MKSAAPAAPTATAPQTAPAPYPYAVSIATFRDEQLDECVDMVTVPNEGQEAAVLEQDQKLSKPGQPSNEVKKITIGKGCADQFSDRVILATCRVQDRPATLGRVSIEARYYNLRTVGDSDAYMQECLQMHGDWRPNRDKYAVEHARIRRDIAQVQRLIDESPQ
jgi:hypothetical protein